MYTLFKNATIVTMNKDRDVLSGSSVLIKGNIILGIGREEDLKKICGYGKDVRIVECSRKIILPGFINAHTHVAMSLFKGLGHVSNKHIFSYMFPIEQHLNAEAVHLLSLVGLLETMRSGVTCVCDHYYFIDAVASAILKVGMRGVLGHAIMDLRGPYVKRKEKEYNNAISFLDKYANHPTIKPFLAPHATDTVSDKFLAEIIREAGRRKCLVHMHVSQTKSEYDAARRKKSTPARLLANSGAFSQRFLAAHCIYLTPQDIKLLKNNNVNVVVTPSSEQAYEQLPPIRELHKAGVNIALGTDCVATADTMDIMHEMKVFYYLLLAKYNRRFLLSPADILAMVTINAAKAVGLEGQVGSVEVGKCADLVIMNTESPDFHPSYDIYSSIVLSASRANIEQVIVSGRTIYQNNTVLLVNEMDLLTKVEKLILKEVKRIKALEKTIKNIL